MQRFSLELEELITAANPDGIKLGQLLDTMSGRRFSLLLVALSLPAALPIPASGYATTFALLIILLAFQIMLGRSSPILPQRVRSKNISSRIVGFIQKRGIPFLRRIERFSKPRLEKLSERRFFRFMGVVILIVALVMLMPIPGTNTIFAFTILLMGFGLANNDGLLILCGGILGWTAVAVMIALLTVGGLALYHSVG